MPHFNGCMNFVLVNAYFTHHMFHWLFPMICYSSFAGTLPIPWVAMIDGITMGGVSD